MLDIEIKKSREREEIMARMRRKHEGDDRACEKHYRFNTSVRDILYHDRYSESFVKFIMATKMMAAKPVLAR